MADRDLDKALRAWHASPYDFDRFGEMKDVSGKGQGAASYGRGAAYVAESPAVSGPGRSSYMEEFERHHAVGPSRKIWHIENDGEYLPLEDESFGEYASPAGMLDSINRGAEFGAVSDWLADHLSQIQNQRDPRLFEKLKTALSKYDDKAFADYMNEEADRDLDGDDESSYQPYHASAIRKHINQAAEQFKFGSGDAKGPYSYEVRVHLKPETMLDWDARFDDHHPEAKAKIPNAFANASEQPMDAGTPGSAAIEMLQRNPNASGSTIYNLLKTYHGSDFAASEALFNAGIHGIRYMDGGSRQRGNEIYATGKLSREPEFVDKINVALKSGGFFAKSPNDVFDVIGQLKDLARGNNVEKSIEAIKMLNWLAENQRNIGLRPTKPTYNYVIFHPDFVEAIAQYNIMGTKVRDMGPGVHLKAVDHDPFKGEK